MTRHRRLHARLLCVAAIALGTAACSRDTGEPGVDLGEVLTPEQVALRAEARPTGLKVLVIGVDGAALRVIDPLIGEGRLPALAALRRRGASGTLLAERPMYSPALWTTVATGYPRTRHGVEHFLAPESSESAPTLVTSRHRRTLALWNLTSFFGLENAVVSWWVTRPAEPVRGTLVSDRFARSRWTEWTDGGKQMGLVWPPSLAPTLASHRVDPDSPPVDELRALLPMTPREEAEMLAAERPIFAHGLSVLKFAWCAQRTYENVALALVSGPAQADLSMVFLVALDAVSHTFWHYHEPQAFSELAGSRPGPGDPVVALYEHNDAFIARLLARVDPETVVLVLSDHGFRASRSLLGPVSKEQYAAAREEALRHGEATIGQSGRHDKEGVLFAAGGPFLAGHRLEASQLDVAPTLLYLLGLPVPDEMPGRILLDAMAPTWVEDHPPIRVSSLEGIVPRTMTSLPDRPEAFDAEDLERLRALGYVQ